MIVVSDTTPLITLMKAKRLGVLNEMFGTVMIPKTVYDELTLNPNYQEEAVLIKNSRFIRTVLVKNEMMVSTLQRSTGLDRGESEAIVYADENRADLLLMDEARGRNVAINMGLNIMGSIGILIAAFRDGFMSAEEARGALKLIEDANRHIDRRILEDATEIISDIERSRQ